MSNEEFYCVYINEEQYSAIKSVTGKIYDKSGIDLDTSMIVNLALTEYLKFVKNRFRKKHM
jgi:hypothetical protein